MQFGTHLLALVDVISGQPIDVNNGNVNVHMQPFSSMILVADDIVNHADAPETVPVAAEPEKPVEAGNRYQQEDGSVWKVVSLASHVETQEELVIYQDEASGKVWAMPKSIFIDRKKTLL